MTILAERARKVPSRSHPVVTSTTAGWRLVVASKSSRREWRIRTGRPAFLERRRAWMARFVG